MIHPGGASYTLRRVPDTPFRVERLSAPGESDAAELARLVPQLSASSRVNLETLRAITENPHTALLVARASDGSIVGTLTLATFAIPTGVRAWIEDVVVDEGIRGQGIGAALVEAALEHAADLGARTVDLTSRPSREDANRLYVRLGFARRETNVYRFSLED